MKNKLWIMVLALVLGITGCTSENTYSTPENHQKTEHVTEGAVNEQSEDSKTQQNGNETEKAQNIDAEDTGKNTRNSEDSVSGEEPKNSQGSDGAVISDTSGEKTTQVPVRDYAEQTGQTSVRDDGNQNENQNGQPALGNAETHVHEWEPITTVVHHDEEGDFETYLIQDAYEENITEMVYDPWECCDICQEDCTGDGGAHMKEHALAGEGGGRHTEYYKEVQKTVFHEAEYGQCWVIDHEAWNETIITGYQCDCGATK